MGKVKDIDSKELRLAEIYDAIQDLQQAVSDLKIRYRNLVDLEQRIDEGFANELKQKSTHLS
jgi:uncharacterized protein YoxC|tara:strand:+ start:190 stop:375 length:186 start_codon:yes stop_codon:yes gene_type:complete